MKYSSDDISFTINAWLVLLVLLVISFLNVRPHRTDFNIYTYST